MQISIYYQKDDQYLLDKVEKLAKRERRSKSASLLSILEEYFEAGRKIGEILKDMKMIDTKQLHKALSVQRENKKDKLLGEIMLEENFVNEGQLERALAIQRALKNGNEAVEPKKEKIS